VRKSASAALCVVALVCLADGARGVDGIAISTHRIGGGDGLGVNRSVYGNLIRHDVTNSRVVKSTVLYKGKARGACISYAGDKVALLKLDGHVCVINMDGTGFKELTNTKNHFSSAMDWPIGDWVYYVEKGAPSYKVDPVEKKTIRRVNIVTGVDELVGRTQYPVWQLSLTAHATKESGRFMVTSKQLDFSNPQPWTSPGHLNCGSMVSAGGRYVSEMAHTHADLHIRRWDPEKSSSPRNLLRVFHVNEWNPSPNDGRKYFYRPRWAVNSEKWIVMTHGNNFSCASQTNMVVYNWLDGEQIQVTSNPARGPGNDEGEDFWVAGVSSDFAVGGSEGEAPFTVNLTSRELGGKDWRWDFGDGKSATAPAGKHTYAKAGAYRVTARLGERVLRQTVTVLPRRAPRATVSVMDSTHLVVAFDEPVGGADANVSLKSGVAVESLKFGPLGRKLHVALAGHVGRTDALRLRGIFDRAQAPNAVSGAEIPIVPPPWPSNRDGLVFSWRTRNSPNVHLGLKGERYEGSATSSKGSVRFGRDGEMVLGGGVMAVPYGGAGTVWRGRKTGQLTIEATVTPALARQGHRVNPSRIIACRADHYLAWDGGYFAVHQEGRKLVLYLNNRSQRFELFELTPNKANHFVITVAPKNLACYLDGKRVFQTDKVRKLSWRKNEYCAGMHFGGFLMVPGRHMPWKGKIEGVAVFSRAITPEDAAKDFVTYSKIIASRKKIPRIELKVRLAAKSKVPAASEIRPYRDALVVNEYEVVKVVKGKYAPGKVRIAQWGLLDAKATGVAKVKVGATDTLTIEAFADNPQLEAQVLRDTLDDDFDLSLYVDVTVRTAPKPHLAKITIQPREIWMPAGEKANFKFLAVDQYDNPIAAKVKWSVTGGGRVSAGMYYSGGAYVKHRSLKGKGVIGADGRFHSKSGSVGVVTITAVATGSRPVKATATVAMGGYPSISPAKRLPLHFGADVSGKQPFMGDIDRVRIYNRALTAEEIAANAAGKDLAAEGLVGDWTFDELVDGAFPNLAGKGLTGKIVGRVARGKERGGGFITLDEEKGYVEVAPDSRLDFSQTCTLEAWVRPFLPGGVIMDKSAGGAVWGFRMDSGGGIRIKSMQGWFNANFQYPKDKWTHVAAVYGLTGARRIYMNGKLKAAKKPHILMVR